DRGNGETRRSAERAESKPDVLHEVGHVFAPSLAMHPALVVVHERVTHERDVAKAAKRLAPRIVGRHAERDVAFDAHRDVELELLVDVGGDVGTSEAQVASPAGNAGLIGHARDGAARSTRVTAWEY